VLAYHCEQLSYTTAQNGSGNLPVILQTIITAQMMSTLLEGRGLLRCNPHFVDVVAGQAGRQATPLLESSSAVILASSYILLQKKFSSALVVG